MRPLDCFSDPADECETIRTVWPVRKADLEAFVSSRPQIQQNFIRSRIYKGEPSKILALPSEDGVVTEYIIGRGKDVTESWAGAGASGLPEGDYEIKGLSEEEQRAAALSWALGGYQFNEYKEPRRKPAKLRFAASGPGARTLATAQAAYFIRDLVNTPAGHMLPDSLEAAARTVAAQHDADISVLTGEELLSAGLNMIHAVGRASACAPRLIDLKWGETANPKVTLVGKGVCFDSGGLDIKGASGMSLMKKDMGGAAHVLGLAHMIMAANLPVRLRVLVPAVENAIGGSAFRPGDVLRSHKGLSVEIGNTDAEGRLILADALSVADAEAPDLLVDMATLTGAARAALGPELPALFTEDDDFAEAMAKAGKETGDPTWRMPLWQPYAPWLDSPIADLNNSASKGFAGATTAALFLQRFVEKAKTWCHLDLYAWSVSSGPTRSVGGEAQTIRALFGVIEARLS